MSEITITEMFQSDNLKDIPGYEGLYAVSRSGQVWSYPKKGNRYCAKWLKALLSKNVKGRIKPYYTSRIMLVKDGITKTLRISRLVALTYLPNSQNLPQINHKDGNTSNNHVDNLEWASASSNMSHAVENRLFDIHSGAQDITRSNNGKKTGALNGMKSRRDFQCPKLTASGKFTKSEENLTEPLQGLIDVQIKRFPIYVRVEHISLKCRKTS